MKRTKVKNKLNIVASIAAVLLGSAPVLQAEPKTWTGASDANWTSGGNWSPSALGSGSADGVVYDASSTENLTQTLGQAWSITNLVVGAVGGPVTISEGNTLTLTHSSLRCKLDMSAATADLNIFADFAHSNNAPSVLVGAGRTLTLSNVLSTVKGVNGPGTVRVLGTGKGFWTLANGLTMVLDGANLTNNPPLSLAAPANDTVLVIVTNDANIHLNQNNTKFPLGAGSSAGVNILRVESGTVTVGKSSSTSGGNALQVGVAANSTGILDINGGTVAVLHKNDNYTHENYLQITGNGSANGTVNLNGGLLLTPLVTSAGGNAAINFNGGTMRSNASTNDWIQGYIRLYVQEGGAIFDTANFSVTINPGLEAGSGNGGLTKIGAGTLTLSGASSYSGPTTIGAGNLVLNGSLGGYGDCIISNNAALTVAMAGLGSGNSLVVNSLTLGSGGTANVILNYGTLYSNPSSPAISASGPIYADGSNIIITIEASGLSAGTAFPLIDYTGAALPSLDNFSVVLPPGVAASLVNNAENSSIDLLISAAVPVNSLIWSASFSGDWDFTTPNWNSGSATYQEHAGIGDIVTFDSTAPNTSVTLTEAFSPFSVTVNSSIAYYFGGTGRLTGNASLSKMNSGSLTMSTSNDYTGGTVISSGLVQLGSDSALGLGTVTQSGGRICSDGTAARLMPNDFTLNNQQLTMGDAVNTGSITIGGMLDINSPNQWRTLTLNSDVILAGGSVNGSLQKTGPGTLVMENGTNLWGNQNALIFNGTVALTNAYLSTPSSLRPECGAGYGVSRLIVGPGSVWDNTAGSGTVRVSGGNPTGKTTATNVWDVLGVVQCSNPTNTHGEMLFDKDRNSFVNLYSGGVIKVRFIGTIPGVDNMGYHELNLDGGTLSATANSTDAVFMDGLSACYVRAGGASIDSAGANITIAQALLDGGGQGGLTKTGGGTLTLMGANTYTGDTIVSGGALMVNQNHTASGSITVAQGATLGFLSDAPGGEAHVSAATVNGKLSVAFVGQSGVPSAAAGYVGALNLSGTVAIDVISLPSGLAGGETIPLIRYDSLSGGVALGQLPAGISGSLVNDTNDKTIKLVTAPSSPPQIGGYSLSPGGFEMSGSGGPTGGGYSYYVLSATDAAAPMGAWVPVATNAFNMDGSFSVSLPVVPGEPQRFYRLQLP
jgi:autotransporter-associated beta strand protein